MKNPTRSKWLADWPGRTMLVAIIALVLAHGLALWGFTKGLPPAPWGDEARHTLRVITESLALVWQPWRVFSADGTSPDAAWPAPVGRWVVPVVLLWLLGEGVAVGLQRYLRRLLVVRQGGHAVLLGLCPISIELVHAWVGAKRAVLVLAEQDDVRSEALRAGAAHFSGRWEDERALLQSGAAQADIVACIAGSDTENVDAAIHLARFVEARRDRALMPLQLLVHVGDPFLRASVDAQIDRFAAREVVQMRFFSSKQIAARRLLRDFPLDFWQTCMHPEPRLWIFGLTPMAEELAVAALRLGIYQHAHLPSLALVGRDAEGFRDSLLARWPGANAVGHLWFESAPAELSAAGLARLLEQMPEPSGIYFCHADDGANLAAAMQLQQAFVSNNMALPPLYLHAVQGGRHDLRSELGMHPWFEHFGCAAEVAGEILVGEKLDAMAVRIHEHYVSESLERGEKLGVRRSLQHWPLLPEDLKDDNRFVADHHFVKVRDIGCALVPGLDAPSKPLWNEAQVEALSRVEHERWMIQRLLAGWQKAAQRDDAAKLHPDIVPWEVLAESRRELDRDVVRQVPDLFVEMGLALCHQQRLLVCGPRTPWAFPQEFDQAVDAVLAQACTAAPQAVVLWLGLDSALAWRVAERLLTAKRGRIGVVLSEPLHEWLARLPSNDIRQRVLGLLRQAVGVLYQPSLQAAAEVLQPDVVLQLSIDGSDLPEQGITGGIHWGIDAAGRVLVQPQGKQS